MTKKEEEQLVWRLKERPTAEGVARLVEQGIIKSDEARTLLFSTMEEKNSEEVKALKEQVEYLRNLVDKLASQKNSSWTYVPYTYTVSTPTKYWKNLTMGSASGSSYYDLENGRITMSVASSSQ